MEPIRTICIKTQEKNVLIQDPVITQVSGRNLYVVRGHDGKGNKLAKMMSTAQAMQAIEEGLAKKGW